MSIQSSWRKYWFRESPYFDIALIRIAIVGLQCFLLLSKVYGGLSYAIGLNDLLYQPLPIFRAFMLPWGWHARPDPDLVMIIFWLTLAFGATSFAGLLTNISMLAFALGNIFLQAYVYSFGDFHHPEAVMMIALLAFALSPCGKVLSVDSVLRKRVVSGTARGVPLLDFVGQYAGWPVKLMQWLFPLMYLSAITAKLGIAGLDWSNGFTLQYYLIDDYLRKGDLPLALALSRHHDVLAVAQSVVVLFQTTFFLVMFFPKLRWIYLPIGLAFHFGNYFILDADFPQWIMLYAVYIPWNKVIKWLATTRVISDTSAASVAVDGQ
jgi:hypothetical protein